MIRRDKRSSFGGKLGEEINALWDAVIANQVIPSDGMSLKHTSSGTILKPQVAGGGNLTENNTSITTGGLHEVHAYWQTNYTNLLNAGKTPDSGYIKNPWVDVGSINMLFQPLTNENIQEAANLWGKRNVAHTLIQNVEGLGDLRFPHPNYIGNHESKKWQAADYVSNVKSRNYLAFELFEPIAPIAEWTDDRNQKQQLGFAISLVEMPTGDGWTPVA